MEGDERSGEKGQWSNPYPLPGQGWGESAEDPPPPAPPSPAPDAPPPGVSLSKGGPEGFRFPLGGRTVASEKRRMRLFLVVPFAGAMLVVVGVTGYKISTDAGSATDAFASDGGQAPGVRLKAAKKGRVGRAKAVRVHADAVVRGAGGCSSPTGSVDVVAVPGTGPGKTTVFVVVRDTGVPDAAPAGDVRKIIASVRPS